MLPSNPIKIGVLFFILTINSLNTSAQSASPILDSLLNVTLDSMRTVLNNKSLSAAIDMPNNCNWAHATGVSGFFSPVTTNDDYLIGSVTKTMTAACILQLVDDQLINLDDSLYEWLDTIAFIDPTITIRQLLRHQSGLYDVLSNPLCQPALMAQQDSIWEASDLINTFIQAPISQPGTNWNYCNTNYFLLGMIIQQVTGNPYYTELRNRFFTPLGMNTIANRAVEIVPSPVAHVWIDLNGDGTLDDAHSFYYNYLSLNSAAGAAGAYYATPKDISKWMRTYMRGDLHSISTMNEAKTTIASPGLPGTTYGLGLMKKSFFNYQGFGHGGDLSYSASSWYFPALDISISVLNNDSHINSWQLAPVVAALIKTYAQWTLLNGVSESATVLPITVFPIPFSESLTASMPLVEKGSTLSYQLNNELGEVIPSTSTIYSTENETFIQLKELESLPKGLYFLNLFIDGQPATTLKLMK